MDRRQFTKSLAGAVLLNTSCKDARPAENTAAKRLLILSQTAGFRHTSIPTARSTIQMLGRETGAWDVAAEADTPQEVARVITAEALRNVDAVVFANTTGDLAFTPAGRQAFYTWMRAGGAYVGVHSASDTFHEDPDYLPLVGGEFATHGPQTEVEVVVQDPSHPACSDLPRTFRIYDEIYEFKNWSRAAVHVLLAMHKHPQTGQPGDFPLAWTNRFGKGKAFYTALGHREDVYENPLFRSHLAGGILWALGLRTGDDSPGNPIR